MDHPRELEQRTFNLDPEMADIVERIKDRYGYTEDQVIEFLLELGKEHILKMAKERFLE